MIDESNRPSSPPTNLSPSLSSSKDALLLIAFFQIPTALLTFGLTAGSFYLYSRGRRPPHLSHTPHVSSIETIEKLARLEAMTLKNKRLIEQVRTELYRQNRQSVVPNKDKPLYSSLSDRIFQDAQGKLEHERWHEHFNLNKRQAFVGTQPAVLGNVDKRQADEEEERRVKEEQEWKAENRGWKIDKAIEPIQPTLSPTDFANNTQVGFKTIDQLVQDRGEREPDLQKQDYHSTLADAEHALKQREREEAALKDFEQVLEQERDLQEKASSEAESRRLEAEREEAAQGEVAREQREKEKAAQLDDWHRQEKEGVKLEMRQMEAEREAEQEEATRLVTESKVEPSPGSSTSALKNGIKKKRKHVSSAADGATNKTPAEGPPPPIAPLPSVTATATSNALLAGTITYRWMTIGGKRIKMVSKFGG